ncbi:hypothetical protein GQ651_11660 [Alphaproteobacteria bacterium GH1-50]|uniref:Uncharacterized protein n=1 Tax=Kangsaoukella pontilimi TaxID=2691042 RepID=A0A7C9IR87_9RHOB|nr:hypothetical protein [Kangsaoukella pontilimi]MXQ08503.1 hypothetical protein [Kangsaoukella pontilimi]
MPDNSRMPSLPIGKWGFWAVTAGVVALLFVFFQIFGPTLEPKPSAAQQIGEMAGEMKRAAWRSFLGLKQPEPEQEAARSVISQYLPLMGPIFGVVAIVLSLISALMRENWHYPVYGAALGIGAIVFQIAWWVLLVVLGIMLLVSIIENLGDFFSF